MSSQFANFVEPLESRFTEFSTKKKLLISDYTYRVGTSICRYLYILRIFQVFNPFGAGVHAPKFSQSKFDVK